MKDETANENICPHCEGYGYTIEVEAQCCGNYKEYGCCGVPEPVQVQVECKCDRGYIPLENLKTNHNEK